jgi:hypothetical protein
MLNKKFSLFIPRSHVGELRYRSTYSFLTLMPDGGEQYMHYFSHTPKMNESKLKLHTS